MNTTTIGLKRNTDGIDLIVADNNYYIAYLTRLQAIQRITTAMTRPAAALPR
jgi:hypothetical protein